MSGEVVKMFFLKWLPENEKNYQNRFWHSRHDNCNAMSLQKPRNAQKHSWPLWRIEPTQRRHILILSHVESGVRSPEEKTLCQEICSGVYFFLLRIRICEWAIGLTCKEKNEKSGNEMCRKNIIVCSFDVSYAVIVIFSQQPLRQEVKHHCKKSPSWLGQWNILIVKVLS